jgi:hypothetical protein
MHPNASGRLAGRQTGGPLHAEEAVLLGVTLPILVGAALLWMAMLNRRRIREMQHRERLAMIDRGLVPPPEVDPAGFEQHSGVPRIESPSAVRSRSAGVIMMGLGLGMMVLLTFAAEAPEVGVGVGGAFALLGAAFFVNAALLSKPSNYQPTRDWQTRPPSRTSGPMEPPNPAP